MGSTPTVGTKVNMKNRYGFLFHDFPESVRKDVDDRLVASEEEVENLLEIVRSALRFGIKMDTGDEEGVVTLQKSAGARVRLAIYPEGNCSFRGTIHLFGPRNYMVTAVITLEGMKEV